MRNILISWSYVYVLLATREFIYITSFYFWKRIKFFLGHVLDFVNFIHIFNNIFFIKRKEIIIRCRNFFDIFTWVLYNFVIFIIGKNETGKNIKKSRNDWKIYKNHDNEWTLSLSLFFFLKTENTILILIAKMFRWIKKIL